MQRIGQTESTLIPAGRSLLEHRTAIAWGLIGASVAAIPALWMWGFTVDDALITVRYARHVANGVGWRFNPHGPSTDGVTPLPWPVVLAPFARADALTVLSRSKEIGLCLWIVTGTALGQWIGRRAIPIWMRLATLAAVASCIPLAAYAVSGMETAVATSIATFAVLARSPRASALLAGMTAAFRPEMAAWAFVVGAGFAAAQIPAIGDDAGLGRRTRRRVLSATFWGLVSLAPFTVCALVRLWAWGRAAPLATLAKPGDPSQGLSYAAVAYFVTIVPLLVTAPFALRRSSRAAVIVAAAAAHVCSVIAVGGDWMPYARLFVPILPSLAVAASLLSEYAHWMATASRSFAALTLGAVLLATGGTSRRRVGRDRAALIASARPLFADVQRIATVDVGWVGAATDADIVDLAGVTDPQIAPLPGGHTSKRISATMLLERAPDRVLLYLPAGLPGGHLDDWRDATFLRTVELRFARDALFARHFRASGWLPLGQTGAGYVVLSRDDSSGG